MGKLDNTKEQLEKKADGLLTGKSFLIWWGSYTVLVGILFGLFYLIWAVLLNKWWVIVICIVIIGLIWSTIAYYNQKPKTAKSQD